MEININNLGNISNIDISKDENLYQRQIEKVLEFLDDFNNPYENKIDESKLNFDNVREDEPKDSLTVEEALMNTYEKKYSYFKVTEFVEQ